jgi:hypothetical protein
MNYFHIGDEFDDGEISLQGGTSGWIADMIAQKYLEWVTIRLGVYDVEMNSNRTPSKKISNITRYTPIPHQTQLHGPISALNLSHES